MLGAFGAAAQGFLKKNSSDIPGLKLGKRAWINPGTYKKLWERRGKMRELQREQDLDQKLRHLTHFDAEKGMSRKRKFLTGFGVRQMADYEKKQVDEMIKANPNPKQFAVNMKYHALLDALGANNEEVKDAEGKWKEMATPLEQTQTKELIKELGGLKNALPTLGKAYAERGQGQDDIYTNEHTRALLEKVGAMNKDGKVIAQPLREQNPARAIGLAPWQLGAPGVGQSKPFAWKVFASTPEGRGDLLKVTGEQIANWMEHSGAAQDVLDEMHDAFKAAKHPSYNDIPRSTRKGDDG
jgi:hypothetical protein